MLEIKYFTKEHVGKGKIGATLCLHLTLDARPQINDLVKIQRAARDEYKLLPKSSDDPEDAWFNGLSVLTNNLNKHGVQAEISINDLPMAIRRGFEKSLLSDEDGWKQLYVSRKWVLTLELAGWSI